MLLLFKFHLYFLHFLTDTFVRGYFACLEEHFPTEDEEEGRGEKVGNRFRDQGRNGVAEQGGEDGHSDECREGGCEDNHSVMAHRHQGCD